MSDVAGCANCGLAADGPAQKFCPECGQPTPSHRIDWHFMLHELEHSVLHMDRGILYSLKELVLRPGQLMGAYLAGRRAKQAKPFLLLMVTAAAVVFLGKLVLGGHVVETALPAGYAPPVAPGDGAQATAAAVAEAGAVVGGWMNRNFAVATLLLIPLEALAFRLAFIGTGRLNYPEWLVVTAFLTVQTLLFWGLSLPLQPWFPQATTIAVGVAICYELYSLVQLFTGYPRWKTLLRALVGLGLFGIGCGVITAILVVSMALSRFG